MLTLVYPLALGLLGALAVVALFYFLRMRFRRQPVSSTFLWASLAQVNEGGARLRWRSLLLLLLQCAAVVALVLALTGPQLVLEAEVRPGTLYLLDTSASMGARTENGTRLDAARRAILADREGREPGPVAFYTGGSQVFVIDGLEPFLPTVATGSAAFSEGPAADVLRAWLPLNPGSWTGVLVSDGGVDQGGTRLASLFEGRWRTLAIGDEAVNHGITDLRLVPGSPGTVTATFFSTAPTRVGLVLAREGVVVDRREVDLPSGVHQATWSLALDSEPALWEARLEGNDALAGDDRFLLSVEAPRRARVLHLGQPDPFLKAAFPRAHFVERQGTSVDGGPWDLVLTEGALPEDWSGPLVTWGALPPDAPVFWGEAASGAVAGGASHPLSRWVPWDEVAVTEGRGLVVQPGATVLAEAGGWPVAATWTREGSPQLALGLGTRGSNLALTAALPVLMRNLRQTVVPQEDNPLAANLRVGQTSYRAGSPQWRIEGVEALRRGGLWELQPRRSGTFRWTDGAESGVIAVNLPASESDIAPRAFATTTQTAPITAGSRAQAWSLVPWLAFLALAFLAVEWRLWNGRFDPRSNRLLAGLRGAAAVAALLALAGLSLPWPTTDRNLVLAFDASASLGADLEAERRSALSLLDALAPTDRVALLAFAGEPRVLTGLQPRDQARASLEAATLSDVPQPDATDLNAALATGAQLLAGQPGASQVVFTDGRTNRGGSLDHASPDAKRYPVSVVPLGRPRGGVAAKGLTLPETARPGEQTWVRWEAEADRSRSLVLDLSVDGKVVESRRVDLVAGTNEVEFVVDVGETGNRTVAVTARDAEGAVDSAQAAALLSVEGRAEVLVVQGPASSAGLAQALRRQGLPTRVGPPSALPESALGYQTLSAVVLDNVPASSLSADQQARLRDWVAGGGGLLVVGGTSSLGRGEYYTSALEDLLPVQTDNRQRLQFTRSRILFVIDHSGSMSEEVGSSTKLEAALGGVAQSLEQLTLQDEVGILQFDSEANWVLPFTPLTRRDEVVAALDLFSQGGGTDLTKALDEVAAAFGRPGPVKRHVILMTDGQTGGEDQFYEEFTETMKAAQVSMTVLGIGHEVNDALLEGLARDSDGVYYRARGDDIPAILHKETVRVTREQIQEGSFPPLVVERDAVLDLGTAPPPVLGYLVTKAKPLARVRWQVARADGDRDPLYADWRFGAGRVAVFASDSGTRWLAPWSGRPEYNRFWGQAVRSLETASRDKTLRMEVDVEASVARVTVEALDGRGHLRTGAALAAGHEGQSYSLTEVAPGRYQTNVPLTASGLQLITLADRAGEGRTWAWAWSPSGAELSQGGADWSGLGRLAAATGGLLQPLDRPQPPPPRASWTLVALGGWLLVLALLLFVLELGIRSTSMGQGKAARTLFVAWWTDQARPWTKRTTPPAARDEAEVERRTREAYKYLAQRKRPGA